MLLGIGALTLPSVVLRSGLVRVEQHGWAVHLTALLLALVLMALSLHVVMLQRCRAFADVRADKTSDLEEWASAHFAGSTLCKPTKKVIDTSLAAKKREARRQHELRATFACAVKKALDQRVRAVRCCGRCGRDSGKHGQQEATPHGSAGGVGAELVQQRALRFPNE